MTVRRIVAQGIGRLPVLAGIFGMFLAGCDGGSDPVVNVDEITISGTVSAIGGAPLDGVTVKAIAILLGQDVDESTTTTDANGNFTLTVVDGFTAYYQFSKSGYLTINSDFKAYTANLTGVELELPTVAEADQVIGTAYPGLTLTDGGWLAINVENGSAEVANATVTVVSAGEDPGYTECDGTIGMAMMTVAPCIPDRMGAPMYFDHYDSDQVVTITVSGVVGTTSAPVRHGEATVLVIEQ